MATYADITVSVTMQTGSAALCVFHEDLPEEQEVWVPFSVIEDIGALDDENEDGEVTISVARWFLKSNDIPYEG